jgi:hypothetical protein
MAGCFLSVSGESFDVESFLKTSFVWRKYASTFYNKNCPGQEKPIQGLHLDISDDEDTITVQIERAIIFLEEQEEELRRLRCFPGVQEIELRFGGWWYEDTVAFFLCLPSKLVERAGQFGIEICVGIYATSREQEHE